MFRLKQGGILLILLLMQVSIYAGSEISIIPMPNEIVEGKGSFILTPKTQIVVSEKSEELQPVVNYLRYLILAPTGYFLDISDNKNGNSISLVIDKDFGAKDGSYKLTVEKNQIMITSGSAIGCFYGVQTLRQLFPPEFESKVNLSYPKWQAPCVTITDAPRFTYRGLHLDVGRHFFPVEFIFKYIDMLAMHKMSVFHWHLTEDQGWRIEIKKYPKLAEIGGFRKETIVGHAGSSKVFDEKPYGGFYTQDEIRQVVKYAKERFITVIPEIELPGHSQAALAAYPELGCTGGPYEVATTFGVFKEVYCAGKDNTFDFMEDVLTEVMDLFPSKYIHIGGDECPKSRWEKCELCQKRIKDEGLHNEHELQSYFIKRIEKFLNSKGRKIIGWDEILEGGLAPDATVMSWRGIAGGIEAAHSEHDVVMTPNTHCYFDHYQGNPEYEPHGIGGFLTLHKVYTFDPIPEDLEVKYHKYIKGGQGNIWTEYMPTNEHVEYMVNPRLAAISEALWSEKEDKNWNCFQDRMRQHFRRLDFAYINYSKGSYKIEISVDLDKKGRKATVTMESSQYKPEIHYTLDGTMPTVNSPVYSKPLTFDKVTVIKAGIFENGKLAREVTSKTVGIHKALGAGVKLKNSYNSRYKAGGDFGLVDGLTGSNNLSDGLWQGFEGVDFEAIIDLEKKTKISDICISLLQNTKSWVFLPEYVEIFVSNDGKKFNKIKIVNNDVSVDVSKKVIKTFEVKNLKEKARYIKVFAKNIGKCPEGHPGEGGKAWLFVDEIIVN